MLETYIKHLEGAYRKLKSYYYYNRNFLPIRKKIVDFEYDSEKMQNAFFEMANVLMHPQKKSSKIYLESLYNQIDFYVIPKKFESVSKEKNSEQYPVSNISDSAKVLTDINFFIDAPIEIYIYDVLWALYLAKEANGKRFLKSCMYGNSVRKDVISGEVDYDSNRFFKHFFNQYNNWRNGAFDALKDNYEKQRDSVLFSLDLKSYYYSVKFKFENLNFLYCCADTKKEIQFLTRIQRNVFSKYKEKICLYRKDVVAFRDNEYPLPIGLFSSMVLGNVYLHKFDTLVENTKPLFYGRYVDDILIVYDTDVNKDEKIPQIVNRILCQNELLKKNGNEFSLKLYPGLKIQEKKLKVICLKHEEPRTILDVYDKTIRIIPSQVNPLPDFEGKLDGFEEKVYSVNNLSEKKKIGDIGNIDISSFEIGRFFSSLLAVFSKIKLSDDAEEIKEKNDDAIDNYIQKNVSQIETFFYGSNCTEYYSYWIRYITFLIIVQRFQGPQRDERKFGNVKRFYEKIEQSISEINCRYLKKDLIYSTSGLTLKIRQFLKCSLDVALCSGLALDIETCKVLFEEFYQSVKKYVSTNYFDDSLIPVPMSNYFEYEDDVSYLKMNMRMFDKELNDVERNKKFKWCPRFIHFDEILLLIFYQRLWSGKTNDKYSYTDSYSRNLYKTVNHLKSAIVLESNKDLLSVDGYELERVPIVFARNKRMGLYKERFAPKIDVGVASFEVKFDKKKPTDTWGLHTYGYKKTINAILKNMWNNSSYDRPRILVMPESSIPVYWAKDIIQFCKKTQIAVIAGLSYIEDKNGVVHNCLLNVFPFMDGPFGSYPSCFVYIREKNDYSPLEFKILSKVGKKCVNPEIAKYQVFFWKGVNVSSQVCFELADVQARALMKGVCDVLAVPVYNPDTTYFSKIISSTSRDLHCFIAQSNTSLYGDSRITGPYDRDHKDIVRLKGGVNDNVIIGTINLEDYRKYQQTYDEKLQEEVNRNTQKFLQEGFVSDENEKSKKREIKPFPARFKKKKLI